MRDLSYNCSVYKKSGRCCDLTIVVYIAVALVVQGLMSWDGGATQQSTQSLELHGWSTAEQGVVIGIDRFPGVVATANLWGYLLGKNDAKPFLLLAILAKAGSCLCFGLFPTSWKISMIMARLFMGVWESLFSIWVLGWVGFHAGKNRMVMWNNTLGVAAGVGSAAGGLLASFLTPHFALAYELQAALLVSIFALVVCLPSSALRLRDVAESPSAKPLLHRFTSPTKSQNNLLSFEPHYAERQFESYVLRRGISGDDDESEETCCAQVKEVLSSAVFRNACIAWSLCSFILNGFNCLWQNTAVDVWNFEVWQASVVFLIINFVGGFFGMSVGAGWIQSRIRASSPNYDKLTDVEQSRCCLAVLTKITLYAAICGSMAVVFLSVKIWTLLKANIRLSEWGVILALLVFFILALVFLINAVQGFLFKECRGPARDEVQSTADGIRVVSQNLFGWGLGAFLPGSMTTMFGASLTWMWDDMNWEAVHGAQYTFGMSFVFFTSWFLFFFTQRAKLALPSSASGK